MEKKRIGAVDALRGFAVMGIILLHNIEHFNFYSFPEKATGWLGALDAQIWDMMFFVFSGKTYAIFALLFGLTFHIMFSKAKSRGDDFKWRYLWRLLLLLGFGFFNAIFFPGEILVLYAILGVFIAPLRHLGNKTLLWIAIVLMLQPVEWVKIAYGLAFPGTDLRMMYINLGQVYPYLGGDSFIEMAKANFVTGQLASLNWAWCYGRVCQTVALFIMGMLLGRTGLFLSSTEAEKGRSMLFWGTVVGCALPLTLLMYYFKAFVYNCIDDEAILGCVRIILNSIYNFGFMLCMAGAFLLLYWVTGGIWLQRVLVPYGRMSLTNYVTQSIIGSLIYFGYAMGMHRYCGPTLSLCIGFVFLALQVAFAHWWFAHYQRGPLESLWHRLTWMRSPFAAAPAAA